MNQETCIRHFCVSGEVF